MGWVMVWNGTWSHTIMLGLLVGGWGRLLCGGVVLHQFGHSQGSNRAKRAWHAGCFAHLRWQNGRLWALDGILRSHLMRLEGLIDLLGSSMNFMWWFLHETICGWLSETTIKGSCTILRRNNLLVCVGLVWLSWVLKAVDHASQTTFLRCLHLKVRVERHVFVHKTKLWSFTTFTDSHKFFIRVEGRWFCFLCARVVKCKSCGIYGGLVL